MLKYSLHIISNYRKLLKELITLRRRCYIAEGKSKEKLDNQLTTFLKMEVQVLWPEGWMSLAVLQKYRDNYCDQRKNAEMNSLNQSTESNQSNSFSEKPATTPPLINKNVPINVNSQKSTSKSGETNRENQITTGTILSSGLSITPLPVTTVCTSSEVKVSTVKSRTDDQSEKVKKLLPVDISKTSSELTITPTTSANSTKVNNEPVEKDRKEVDAKTTKRESSTSSTHTKNTNVDEKTGSKTASNHCQVIDLTDHSERKNTANKISQSRHEEKDTSPKLNDSEKGKSKEKSRKILPEEQQTASIYNKLIPETSDHRFAQNYKSSVATSSTNKITDHSIKKLNAPNYVPTSLDFSKPSDGDDIQKVMEGLKVLQKMSSPIKMNESPSSSPVSVIAFNNSYSSKSNPTSQNLPVAHSASHSSYRSDYNKADFGPGFQEAFQRQILNPVSSPTTSKSHLNRYINLF